MKIKKLLITGVLLTMTAFSMVGCGTANQGDTQTTEGNTSDSQTIEESNSEEGTDDLKIVRIATPGIDADGNAAMQDTAAVAQQKGFLEEELNAIGYTAEYYGFASAGVGVNEALAANEVDIAVYGDFPAITYIAAGNEATIIGMNTTRSQIGLYVKDDIQTAEDLKGKKIGTMFGTVAYKYLVEYLQANGISENDVEIINAGMDMFSLFASGDIDAIAQSPQAFYSLQGGHVLAVNGDDSDLNSNHVVIARKDFLDENAEVAQAIVNAWSKAQQYASENPDEVYEMLSKASGATMTAENYKEYFSFNDSFEYWSPYFDDEIIASLQKTADFMFENQYIPTEVKIDQYIDNSITKE